MSNILQILTSKNSIAFAMDFSYFVHQKLLIKNWKNYKKSIMMEILFNLKIMTTIDLKIVSVYDFLEIMNSKWVINDYINNSPEIEVEYFDEKVERELLESKGFLKLQNAINTKVVWK